MGIQASRNTTILQSKSASQYTNGSRVFQLNFMEIKKKGLNICTASKYEAILAYYFVKTKQLGHKSLQCNWLGTVEPTPHLQIAYLIFCTFRYVGGLDEGGGSSRRRILVLTAATNFLHAHIWASSPWSRACGVLLSLWLKHIFHLYVLYLF